MVCFAATSSVHLLRFPNAPSNLVFPCPPGKSSYLILSYASPELVGASKLQTDNIQSAFQCHSTNPLAASLRMKG
eukprot:12050389-Karenia_brevis.AAC.1